jgi:uncharacterized OB-fold protein
MTVRRIEGGLPVAFRYTPGVGNTAFLEALRDRGAFLGSRCPTCGTTYLPARIFCERDLTQLTPDTECGPEGTIESWTIAHRDLNDEPLDPPVTFALVKLDRADTVVLHRLLAPAEIGARVRPMLRDLRAASVLDIEGFEPA